MTKPSQHIINRNRAKALSLCFQEGSIDLLSLQVYLTNLDPKTVCEECNNFARYTGFTKSGDILRSLYYCYCCDKGFSIKEDD